LFDDMMTDTISLVKRNGARRDGIKAIVESTKIMVPDVSLDVDEGDHLERVLPSGKVESFLILDTGFNPGLEDIPPFYQMKVRKESVIRDEQSRSSVVYNVTGPNARVNVNSTDASTNIANVGTSELFEQMRSVVAQGIQGEDERQEMVTRINSMEKSHGTGDFAKRYSDFIALAANHMSIFSPFMPALGQLLGP
jgi:hypothetical protein